ncbi:MAG: YqeG family HAD IIIA-type phosphatase [Lachnospiraceae bacterium]|nr:YqeG family HAD IIIA-type phosphatase [Lachnospiraceae bacterium]
MNLLYPRKYMTSTYHIDFKALYEEGYRGVLFDIDNTLVPHGLAADERALKLMNHLKALGYNICFISNNGKERVEMFNKDIHANYIYKAHKPSVKNYQKAMELMHTDTSNTLFVGDQIFTDVLGANRAGIYSILVQPIHPKEEIQIVLKRYLEKIVLFFYKRKRRKEEKENEYKWKH